MVNCIVPLNWNINKSDIVILSSPNKCVHAMTFHESQFVWYRKLFVIFSRYGWINQFHKILPQITDNNANITEDKKSK